MKGKNLHPGVSVEDTEASGILPCEAGVPRYPRSCCRERMGEGEKLTPARLLYVTLCLAHQARLHSQVLQAAAADKDVSGLGEPLQGLYLPG